MSLAHASVHGHNNCSATKIKSNKPSQAQSIYDISEHTISGNLLKCENKKKSTKKKNPTK